MIQDFFIAGGPVLWPILFTALLIWTLIVERYWFMGRIYPRVVKQQRAQWLTRDDKRSWYAHRIRDMIISQIKADLHRYLMLLKTAIAICPLLGVLGTVMGMVQVFDVVAITGTTDVRAMAAGISMATLPTMAGMVVALSGLYFSSRLRHHAQRKTQMLAAAFEIHDNQRVSAP